MTGPFEEIFAEFERAEAFSRRVRRAIIGLDVGQGAERDLLNIVGAGSTPSELTMAHTPGLKAAAALLCSVVEETYTELASPGTTFYKLTVIDEAGIMPIGVPQLAVPALQRAVERAMTLLKLSGFGFPRLQPVEGGLFELGGDALLLYGQALCWGTEPEGVTRAKLEALNCILAGELAIDVEAVSLERIPPNVVSALCVPASLAGMPDYLWYLEDFNGTDVFFETASSFHIDKALRVAGAFSHVLTRNAVFGVGDGKPLVAAWHAKLSDWHRERISLDVSFGEEAVKIDVDELWSSVRSWDPNYYRVPFTLG